MPSKKNMQQVEELKDRLSRCTIAIATNFTGMSVNDFTELRRTLKTQGIDFRVVKNTLTYIASESAGKAQVKEVVQGPTAIAFGYEDPVQVAKTLNDYIRSNRPALAVRGAVMDGQILSTTQVTALANLPPRPVIVSQLLGQLQTPIAGLMTQLQAPLSRLLALLNTPATALTVLLQQRVQQVKTQG